MDATTLNSYACKVGVRGAAFGVPLATVVAALDALEPPISSHLLQLLISVACILLSARYFLRASFAFSEMRCERLDGLRDDVSRYLMRSQLALVFLNCVNVALITTVGHGAAIALLLLQGFLVVAQWLFVFRPIFLGEFTVDGSVDVTRFRRKFLTAHGLSVFIDMLTLVFVGTLMGMLLLGGRQPEAAERMGTVCSVVVLFLALEIATHIHTEGEWKSTRIELRPEPDTV